MDHDFGPDYWRTHWEDAGDPSAERTLPPNPHLTGEIHDLTPGTALDAGCGEGAEAIWLAGRGWQVTAVDISGEVLARAARHADRSGLSVAPRWVEADLSVWTPGSQFDLVTTHYAHTVQPQLEFYRRISDWVVPGGTLLIVGHLQREGADGGHAHGHEQDESQPPAHASITAASAAASLDPQRWDIHTADERVRSLLGRNGETVELHDVIVRATRRA